MWNTGHTDVDIIVSVLYRALRAKVWTFLWVSCAESSSSYKCRLDRYFKTWISLLQKIPSRYTLPRDQCPCLDFDLEDGNSHFTDEGISSRWRHITRVPNIFRTSYFNTWTTITWKDSIRQRGIGFSIIIIENQIPRCLMPSFQKSIQKQRARFLTTSSSLPRALKPLPLCTKWGRLTNMDKNKDKDHPFPIPMHLPSIIRDSTWHVTDNCALRHVKLSARVTSCNSWCYLLLMAYLLEAEMWRSLLGRRCGAVGGTCTKAEIDGSLLFPCPPVLGRPSAE